MSKKNQNFDLDSYQEKGLVYESALWNQGYQRLVGVDEVGRGCIAGGVVACAIIMPRSPIIKGIKDSKKLTDRMRRSLYQEIIKVACDYQVVFIDQREIDQINILESSKKAMEIAISKLKNPEYVLVDALKLKIDYPQLSIVHGDDLSYLIGCASIVAKVVRDDYMIEQAKIFPGYQFEKNKGYPTAKHVAALKELGITQLHRLTFRPVAEIAKKN